MPERRLTRPLLFPLVLALAAPGCLFNAYRPVTVLVRDAETKQPIHGAKVCLSYTPAMFDVFCPSASEDMTRADGTAHLVAAPHGFPGTSLRAEADGYLWEERQVQASEICQVSLLNWFWMPERRPVTFVLDASPQWSAWVELIVPDGYRGVIKVEVERLAEDRNAPARRRFHFQVPPSGILKVSGPSLLGQPGSHYVARYAGGPPIECFPTADDAVGLRYVGSYMSDLFFVIGTAADAESSYRMFTTKGPDGCRWWNCEAIGNWVQKKSAAAADPAKAGR
jgi:hypothetical protein